MRDARCEIGDWKLDVGCWKLDVGSLKLEIGIQLPTSNLQLLSRAFPFHFGGFELGMRDEQMPD